MFVFLPSVQRAGEFFLVFSNLNPFESGLAKMY